MMPTQYHPLDGMVGSIMWAIPPTPE